MKKLLLLVAFLCQTWLGWAQSNFIRQDTIYATTTNCTADIRACIDSISFDSVGALTFTLDGVVLPNTAVNPCFIDTVHAYSYFVLFQNAETGPFFLESWTVNGQTYSTFFPNLTALTDSMRVWDPWGNWQLDSASRIIFGFARGSSNYSCQIINGLTRGGRNEVCYNPGLSYRGLLFDVTAGRHLLVAENINTGDRDSVVILAACLQSDTLRRSLSVQSTQTVCLDTTLLAGGVAGIRNICPAGSSVRIDSVANACVTFTGLTEGVDTLCMQVCDTFGLCDTTYIIITVTPLANRSSTFSDTISLGASRQKCDIARPTGQIGSIVNLCPSSSGTEVRFSIDTANICVTYTGLRPGTDTLCLQVCNTSGLCDTTYMYIRGVDTTRLGSRTFTDTVAVGGTRVKCDFVLPSGTLNIIENICLGASGTNVAFVLDTARRCLTYTGRTAGADTACLRFCNTNGVCDTTTVIITTTNAPAMGRTHVFRDTITAGISRDKCVFDVPPGRLFIFQNVCASASGNEVRFVANDVTRCVTYTGLVPGIDTACIQICDTSGICDTTFMYVTTLAAVTDSSSFVRNDSVLVGGTITRCNLPMPANPVLIQNICAANSGTNVSFVLDTVNFCVTFRGLTSGVDTACIRICNAAGQCDTTSLRVNARPTVLNPTPSDTSVTLRILERLTVCLDTMQLAGSVVNTIRFCTPSTSNVSTAVLDTATKCVTFTGVRAGRDTVCVAVCNVGGLCDTTRVFVNVLPDTLRPVGSLDSAVVFVGDSLTLCRIDTSQIGGAVDTIFNACSGSSGVNARVSLTASNCLKINGLSEGVDTACIVVCNRLTGLCDTTTFYIRVTARPRLSPSDYADTLKIGELLVFCPDPTELLAQGSPVTSIVFCGPTTFNNATFSLDTVTRCVRVRGVSAGIDTACVALCNAAGVCDTTNMFITVTPDTLRPVGSLDSAVVFVGDSLTLCRIDTSQIGGAVDTIFNACSGSSGVNARVSLTASNCLKINGLSEGVDTACIVVCNRLTGLCDTTTFYIRVTARPRLSPSDYADTLKIGELLVFCPDPTELLAQGSPVTSIVFCGPTTFNNATFSLDTVTRCVRVRGVSAGIDTACVALCNAAGVCDTTNMFITVTPDTVRPVTRIDTFSLVIGADSVYCGVDTTQIFGTVDTIFDACPGSNGSNARMVLDRQTRCVTVTGLTAGQDTMCLVVCNRTSGLCDTTTLIVTVRDTISTRVIAVDDADTLRQGAVKNIRLYLNDTLSRVATGFEILDGPRNNTATVVSVVDGIIRYQTSRAPSACGLDSFRYRVCIDSVCDTATVRIFVACSDSIVVYNGFSPNGDGINDVFVIDGLQNFPQNTLCVFNRWGNEVLRRQNYENDWDGTWDSKMLPDGTYFYMLRDDSSGQIVKTGYVVLMR